MKRYIFLPLFALLTLSIFNSCKDNDNPDPNPLDKMEIATMAAANLGYDVTLWADDSLFTGYNTLFVEVVDPSDKSKVTDLEITATPVMTMPSMTHSAPVEQPGTVDADNIYPFAVVFIMPSGAMGSWVLTLNLRDPVTDQKDEITIPVEIITPAETRVRNMMAMDDSSKVFVSLVSPLNPKVGMNDFELAVHHKASMMNFPALEGLEIEIEPEMPSMGHGSPNNEHPTYTSMGHYKGVVNFTMDGWWQVHVRLKRGGALIAETDFNITLQAK